MVKRSAIPQVATETPVEEKSVSPPIQKPEKGVKPAIAKPKLGIYIHRALKKVDTEGYSLAKSTVAQISILLMSFARTMANRTIQLMNRVTVDDRAVCFAARSLLDEHYLPVFSKGHKAMEEYKSTLGKLYKETMSSTTRW
jgi:hypothetical protein